jgi:Putative lumazine-binding
LLGALIAVQSRPDRGRIGRTAGTRECRFEPEEVAMTARTDDYDEILRVMQLYVDAFNDNDVGKFKEAFHEDAWIFYIDANGALHKNPISEDFERWQRRPVGASWVDSSR